MNGLVYYHPLNESLTTLPTGQTVESTGTWMFSTVNGVPCATKANGTACIILSDDSTIPVADSSRTMSIWILCTRTNAIDVFGYGGSTTTNAWKYRIAATTGYVTMPPQGSRSYDAASAWHHYVTTFDKSTHTVNYYVDGVDIKNPLVSSSLDTSAVSASAPVFIGINAWQYGFSAAGARIYDRVLTPIEIQELAREFTPTAS